MGLDIPDLDDRTYEEIIDDARKRIPVHAPEWTDHNAHDPGVTILELLAWLSESYGYQLDQVTDDHRRKYLDLAGVRPHPPQPATVALSVDVSTRQGAVDEPDEWFLERGTRLLAETEHRERIPFQTTTDVALTQADIVAVVTEHGGGRTDHTTDNETEGRSFLAFGRDGTPGDTLYLGFDGDPFEHVDSLDLWFERHGERLLESLAPGDDTAASFEPSIVPRWEHCLDLERWYHDDEWAPIEVERDTTNRFYGGGRVALREPDSWRQHAMAGRILGSDEPLFWLRCRLEQRDPPSAEPVPVARLRSNELTDRFEMLDPPADDSKTDEPPRRQPQSEQYERPPRFDSISTNVVVARHRETDAGVSLVRNGSTPGYGESETTGEPNQQFSFPDAPVERAEIEVGGVGWERVDDFDSSGPNDTHFVLDRQAGIVRFGDGRRGAIPPVGRTVVAEAVVYGGGPAGNVGSSAEWAFVEPAARGLGVEPRSSPVGGRNAESVADALGRARAQRHVPHRAVTAADYRELAKRTPTVQVERAEAIVGECAGDIDAGANHVTVVVVPDAPSFHRRAEPTRGFLRAVERHLCVRSLLTDRVSVVGPTYVGVRITAEISVVDGHTPSTVREAAVDELTAYLDPLDGYDGNGWPFDRPIHSSELFERLESVRGVEDAIDVSVAVGDGPDLKADNTTLPYPESVTVTVGETQAQCGGRP